MNKQYVTTSWSVTYFWIVFSALLATFSTYSFVQEDWIVKRESILVTHYHFTKHGSSSEVQLPSAQLRTVWKEYPKSKFELEDGERQSNYVHYANTDGEFGHLQSDYYSRGIKNLTVVKRIRRTVTVVSLGVFGVCTNVNGVCQCEHHARKRGSVSPIWPMLTLAGSLGCLMLCTSAVMSILAVALPSSILRYKVARTIGQAQAVSVGLLFLTLLGFPLGFQSTYLKLYCGPTAGPYSVGVCEVGWAYAVLIVCAALALYCPVLVHFTISTKRNCLPKYM